MSIQVITFKCVLKNKAGQLIGSTYNRDVLTGPTDQNASLNALALGLQNLKSGEKRVINLTAAEAYGFYDPQKVILFPRNKLPKHIKVGEPIAIVGKSGQTRRYRVLEIHDNMVSLDQNHSLAGQDLTFEIEVLSAREALPEDFQEKENLGGAETMSFNH